VYALVFWYGSTLVANKTITFRELNQSMFGILMTAMAMGQNIAIAPDLGKGQAAVNSIFRLLERKSKIDPFNPEGQKPSVLLGDLSFENIDFAYPTRPDVTVLAKFNLQVKHGQTVAFVGTSGSGKSTLVLLLERFYDPLAGCVKVDGIDVRELNLEWLRGQIGIVSQEPVLFKGSIMENIRSGRPDATDEEVIEAAKMANAHDFIMSFGDKYETNLLQASGVSGGQKQRVAIARALLRNPPLLLLDEATSALDEESQKVVQVALDKLLQQQARTTIIVAHRLSTIRNADVIVVLQHGVVVEQGSFEELASKPNGAFQSLLQAQGKFQ
jgi:ATP-binding cassette subfamily B (MDR/TAP) protein 1